MRLSFFAPFVYIYVADDVLCLSDYCVNPGYPPALMWTSHPLCDLQNMGSYYLVNTAHDNGLTKTLKTKLCSRSSIEFYSYNSKHKI